MFKRKKNIAVFSIICAIYSTIAMADDEPIWNQTYHDGISKFTLQPTEYCDSSTPGTFIGTVQEQLKYGALTNKNIRLSNFTFSQKHVGKNYIITGNVIEQWNGNGRVIKDQISYNLHKTTEDGTTIGTWTNSECQGKYIGFVIKTN